MLKRIAIVLLALIGLTYIGFLGLGSGWFGSHEGPGTIEGAVQSGHATADLLLADWPIISG